jgi:type VI secretion system Hcp family effector
MPEQPHVVTAYCKIDGIDGSCTHEKHDKWVQLTSFSHIVDQAVSDTGSAGIGITTGTSQHKDMVLEAFVDSAYAKLLQAASGGKPIKEVKIEVCQAVGDKQNPFLLIDLNECAISHVGLTGNSTGFPIVNFTVNYGTISVEHKATKPDGSQAGAVKMKYNRRTHKVE